MSRIKLGQNGLVCIELDLHNDVAFGEQDLALTRIKAIIAFFTLTRQIRVTHSEECYRIQAINGFGLRLFLRVDTREESVSIRYEPVIMFFDTKKSAGRYTCNMLKILSGFELRDGEPISGVQSEVPTPPNFETWFDEIKKINPEDMHAIAKLLNLMSGKHRTKRSEDVYTIDLRRTITKNLHNIRGQLMLSNTMEARTLISSGFALESKYTLLTPSDYVIEQARQYKSINTLITGEIAEGLEFFQAIAPLDEMEVCTAVSESTTINNYTHDSAINSFNQYWKGLKLLEIVLSEIPGAVDYYIFSFNGRQLLFDSNTMGALSTFKILANKYRLVSTRVAEASDLMRLMNAKIHHFPKSHQKIFYSRSGWGIDGAVEGTFLFPESDTHYGVFAEAETYYLVKGQKFSWVNDIYYVALKDKYLCMSMLSSFASPLIEKFKIPNLLINFYGADNLYLQTITSFGNSVIGAPSEIIKCISSQQGVLDKLGAMKNDACFFVENIHLMCEENKTSLISLLVGELRRTMQTNKFHYNVSSISKKTGHRGMIVSISDEVIHESIPRLAPLNLTNVINIFVKKGDIGGSELSRLTDLTHHQHGKVFRDYIFYLENLEEEYFSKIEDRAFKKIKEHIFNAERICSDFPCLKILTIAACMLSDFLEMGDPCFTMLFNNIIEVFKESSETKHIFLNFSSIAQMNYAYTALLVLRYEPDSFYDDKYLPSHIFFQDEEDEDKIYFYPDGFLKLMHNKNFEIDYFVKELQRNNLLDFKEHYISIKGSKLKIKTYEIFIDSLV